MTQHTPGPWTYDPSNSRLCDKIMAEKRPIARLVTPVPRTSGLAAETAANARLIAAAPDLLEALRRLSANAHTYTRGHIAAVADAAIAKATGDE